MIGSGLFRMSSHFDDVVVLDTTSIHLSFSSTLLFLQPLLSICLDPKTRKRRIRGPIKRERKRKDTTLDNQIMPDHL
jgi:hypothetical protein